jgi:hypothetical protein
VTRDQFLSLAGQLFDAQNGGGSPRGNGTAPKFDTALPAGSGEVVYASECSLKELRYQLSRADKPPKEPKYAEANKKRSRALGYWVTYRESNPDDRWTGERNREQVTAALPDDRPAKHPRVPYTPRDDEASRPATTDPEYGAPTPGGGFADDTGDIPF